MFFFNGRLRTNIEQSKSNIATAIGGAGSAFADCLRLADTAADAKIATGPIQPVGG
jgi:hypothetical protein